MQNTVFVHALALNIDGTAFVFANVSVTGRSEESALKGFKTAYKTYMRRISGEDCAAPSTKEILRVAARPVAEAQHIINAVKRFSNTKLKRTFFAVLRQYSYNAADGKTASLYCPDTLSRLENLAKNTRDALISARR